MLADRRGPANNSENRKKRKTLRARQPEIDALDDVFG